MKFYRFGSYDYECSIDVYLYNEDKDYSDDEFKILCANIVSESLDEFWNKEKENYKSLMNPKNIVEKVYYDDINFDSDIIFNKFRDLGFKILETESNFTISNCRPLLEDINDENKLIKQQYEKLKRIKKLKRILK